MTTGRRIDRPELRVALLAALLLVAPAAPAQVLDARENGMAPAAEWGLAQLMAHLATVKTSSKRFVEKKYSNLLTEPLVLKGTLKYVAPTRIEKHVTSPREESLVVDGDQLTLENRAKGQKRSIALSQYPVVWAFVEAIRSTLAGNVDTLKRFYALRFQGERKNWTLHLEPLEPQMSQIVESILISGDDDHITQIEIRESGGDRSVMTIS